MTSLGRFTSYLVDQGYLTARQADAVEQKADATRERLGQLMLRHRYVTAKQMLELLRIQKLEVDLPIGQLAVEAGYLNEAQLDELLAIQLESRRHVAQLLVDEGVVDPVMLLELMATYIKWAEASVDEEDADGELQLAA